MDWDVIWCERDWMARYYDLVHFESWQRVRRVHIGVCMCFCDNNILFPFTDEGPVTARVGPTFASQFVIIRNGCIFRSIITVISVSCAARI